MIIWLDISNIHPCSHMIWQNLFHLTVNVWKSSILQELPVPQVGIVIPSPTPSMPICRWVYRCVEKDHFLLNQPSLKPCLNHCGFMTWPEERWPGLGTVMGMPVIVEIDMIYLCQCLARVWSHAWKKKLHPNYQSRVGKRRACLGLAPTCLILMNTYFPEYQMTKKRTSLVSFTIA